MAFVNINYSIIDNPNNNITNLHTLNNFYTNTNLNPIYNFNNLYDNQQQNRYILLLKPNYNQQIISQPYPVLRLNLNGLNYQHKRVESNDIQPRITNINLQNRYVLDNNLNLENRRIPKRYKLINNEKNFSPHQNNFMANNYGLIPEQNINRNINVPKAYNNFLDQRQIRHNNNNIGQIKLNNITTTNISGDINPANDNNDLNKINNMNSNNININKNLNNINNINLNTPNNLNGYINHDNTNNTLNIINNMNSNNVNINKNLNNIKNMRNKIDNINNIYNNINNQNKYNNNDNDNNIKTYNNNKIINNIPNIGEDIFLPNKININFNLRSSDRINNEFTNNIQNNINSNQINNRIFSYEKRNVQKNINLNRLNNFQKNNNVQTNIFSNMPNSNFYNSPNNPSLNKPIDPLIDELVNQDTNQASNQEIDHLLNNNNLSFQTVSNKNDNNLINIDDYLFNQQEAIKSNDLNIQQQVYQKPQTNNQNTLINQQKNQQMNPSLKLSPLKNHQNLRLTFSPDNYLKELQNEYMNQNQDTNQLQNNYNGPQNSFLNQPISQSGLFSPNNNYLLRGMNDTPIEGSILKNFAYLSRPGNDELGLSKTNQDSFILKTNINNIKDFSIFGVLDGHGPSGHLISKFASSFIPNYIINYLENKKIINPESIYLELKKNNYQIIKQAFIFTDKQLKSQNFDSKESGSTCVLVILIGNHLICANVGDSRAIAVFDEQNDKNLNNLNFIPLSIDYKPELPEEKNRIINSGGLVMQTKNSLGEEIGPYRVYAPGEDYPALAMSRSIGDSDGKNLGVIAEPGIIEYTISRNTKYVVLCSDGVWEFLTNEHVKNLGKEFYLSNNPNGFCQELIVQSVIEWKGNDNLVDDITTIVLYF